MIVPVPSIQISQTWHHIPTAPMTGVDNAGLEGHVVEGADIYVDSHQWHASVLAGEHAQKGWASIFKTCAGKCLLVRRRWWRVVEMSRHILRPFQKVIFCCGVSLLVGHVRMEASSLPERHVSDNVSYIWTTMTWWHGGMSILSSFYWGLRSNAYWKSMSKPSSPKGQDRKSVV